MKQKLTFFFVMVVLALVVVWGQSPRGKTEITLEDKGIEINYGRPELRGRDMLARLKPGNVWRLGSDHATSLSTEANLVFGEITVPEGRYSLFAKYLGPNEWQLLVNSKTGIWGTNHEPGEDIAAIPLKGGSVKESVEKFTIALKSTGADSGEFSMAWGTMRARVRFKVK